MVLNNKYYFKKGGVVQIVGGVIYVDKVIWGDDVVEFNLKCFLNGLKGFGVSFYFVVFRGFGGGKILCFG